MKLVPKAQIIKVSEGIIKMVVDPRNEQIVVVHIVSALAAEIIHEAIQQYGSRQFYHDEMSASESKFGSKTRTCRTCPKNICMECEKNGRSSLLRFSKVRSACCGSGS